MIFMSRPQVPSSVCWQEEEEWLYATSIFCFDCIRYLVQTVVQYFTRENYRAEVERALRFDITSLIVCMCRVQRGGGTRLTYELAAKFPGAVPEFIQEQVRVLASYLQRDAIGVDRKVEGKMMWGRGADGIH